MLPLALGLSGDPSFCAPMAVAVIGGLITSTLLSLLVAPAAFTYVDDAGHWVGRMGGSCGSCGSCGSSRGSGRGARKAPSNKRRPREGGGDGVLIN